MATGGIEVGRPVDVAAGGESPALPTHRLKNIEALVLTNKPDTVKVDVGSLDIKLIIDMGESNRQASPFNLDVYDLSNVGEGVTYRSGKVAFGWGGPLSSFVGLAENLEVKNADKIILTNANDTVVSANY